MNRVIISFLFVCLSFSLKAQEPALRPVPVETSSEQVRISGQLFYIHHVLKQQTLYSISRHYGVSIDEIKKHNPLIETEGLRENSNIKIPVVLGHTSPPPAIKPAVREDITTDILTPALSETIYPHEDIKHSLLLDPAYTVVKDTLENLIPAESYCSYLEPDPYHNCYPQAYDPIETVYHMALILPFDNMPEMNFSLTDTTLKELPSPGHFRVSDNYMEFYAGALLAVEDMKKSGFSLDLSVYDVKDLDNILHHNKLRNADVVVGPVYAEPLAKVVRYARRYNINVVSPLDSRADSLLLSNPTLFQVAPSFCSQQLKLLKNISGENSRIILVYESDGGEDEMVNSYKALLEKKTDSLIVFYYKVEKGLAVRDTLQSLLHPEKKNCIVVASNNEALVSDLTSNLSYIHSILKYPITLYGQARWRNFENVDLSFFHSMNLHLVAPFFVDYNRNEIKKFVGRYRVQFKREPTQYAFHGYDVTAYFLTALRYYGKDFADCLPALPLDMLQGNYIFRRLAEEQGFINTGSWIVHYLPDYSIVRE
jgi:hypothetical protein